MPRCDAAAIAPSKMEAAEITNVKTQSETIGCALQTIGPNHYPGSPYRKRRMRPDNWSLSNEGGLKSIGDNFESLTHRQLAIVTVNPVNPKWDSKLWIGHREPT